MTLIEGPHLLFAEVDTQYDAHMLLNFKLQSGWEILSLPFPTNYELVDVWEETAEAQPRTWCIIMHRRPVRINRIAT